MLGRFSSYIFHYIAQWRVIRKFLCVRGWVIALALHHFDIISFDVKIYMYIWSCWTVGCGWIDYVCYRFLFLFFQFFFLILNSVFSLDSISCGLKFYFCKSTRLVQMWNVRGLYFVQRKALTHERIHILYNRRNINFMDK